MKDCRECAHSQYAKGAYLCTVENLPKPTSWMRDPRNSCGLEARLFEPKTDPRYAEHDTL